MLFGRQQAAGPSTPQVLWQSVSCTQLTSVLPPLPLLLVLLPPLPVLPPVLAPPAPPELIATHVPDSCMNPGSHVNEHLPLEQLGVEFVGTGSGQREQTMGSHPTSGEGT